MTYTGHVTSAGPSQVRQLDGLTIRKASVGSMDNNAYLLTCTATGDQLLIDAADDLPRLQQLIAEGTGELSAILTTHRHADHTRALTGLAQATGATTLAGEYDADYLPMAPDRRLRHGEQITLGEQQLHITHLRGHTPGAIAVTWTAPNGQAHLFSGDSLFPGGPGKTSTPEDFAQLMDDLETRLFDVLDDATWVYPGHGDDTTLGAERPHLPQWRERGW
ncbi:MBL fold metallo-hydrolase [Gephyromycinifex aptenodytis]|uniref:MBL fold metallo-hydrolase n=1 Tax=Gephyromycinifex aptenodytis TaxID=2716227 RepID=UPI001444E58B|nr:MBL fold metallo-hydrolase [Gephyromycinifex aptenodytis]